MQIVRYKLQCLGFIEMFEGQRHVNFHGIFIFVYITEMFVGLKRMIWIVVAW